MMHRLATLHSVTDERTDRETDRRHHRANSRLYCVQTDRLKSDIAHH